MTRRPDVDDFAERKPSREPGEAGTRGTAISRRSWLFAAVGGAALVGTAALGVVAILWNSEPEPAPSPSPPLIPPPPIPPRSLALSPGTDGTFSSLPFISQCADAPYAQTIDATKQLIRFELREGDRWRTDIADHDDRRERTEMSFRSPLSMETSTWIAFDVAIFGDLSQMWPGGSTLFHQVFQRPAPGAKGGPPIVAFQVTQDLRLRITVRGEGNRSSIAEPSTDTVVYEDAWRDEGKVTRYVYRLRPDPTDGSIIVWRNGTPIAMQSGVPIGYPDPDGANSPYAKIGLYRAASPSAVVA